MAGPNLADVNTGGSQQARSDKTLPTSNNFMGCWPFNSMPKSLTDIIRVDCMEYQLTSPYTETGRDKISAAERGFVAIDL